MCISVGEIEARSGTPIFEVLQMLVNAHDEESPECGPNRKLRFATTIELQRNRGHLRLYDNNQHGEAYDDTGI